MLEQTALEELPQHPLDHRSKSTPLPAEAHGPHPQQLLQVALDELEERRLARPPRPVDPAGDLHAQPRGGESPSAAPAEVRVVREPRPEARLGEGVGLVASAGLSYLPAFDFVVTEELGIGAIAGVGGIDLPTLPLEAGGETGVRLNLAIPVQPRCKPCVMSFVASKRTGYDLSHYGFSLDIGSM